MNKRYEGDERRCTQYVTDRPAERGIIVNNGLTALLAIIMGAVWNSVDDMEKAVIDVAKQQSGIIVLIASQGSDIDKLEHGVDDLEDVMNKHFIHHDTVGD